MNVDFDQQDIIIELPPEGKDGRSIHPAGEWSADAEYHTLDLVSYQESSYIAERTVPAGTLPTDAEYWQVVAEKGEPGASEWGEIAGNIADQTDLQDALDSKADASDVAEALAGKANVGDSYTKTEENALLAGKADADDVYTKTQADALLQAKANTADLGTLASQDTVNYQTQVTNKPDFGGMLSYTETAMKATRNYSTGALIAVGDKLYRAITGIASGANLTVGSNVVATTIEAELGTKANSADVYGKTEVYTKAETDTLLDGKLDVTPTTEMTGSIVIFDTPIDNAIKDLSVNIDPVQDLHGYDNPWPAGGGKNKFSVQWLSDIGVKNGTATISGESVTVTATANDCYTNYGSPFWDESYRIPVSQGDVVRMYWNVNTTTQNLAKAGIFPNGGSIDFVHVDATLGYCSLTVPSGYTFVTIRLSVPASGNSVTFSNIMVTVNNSDATFAPYSNICPISGHTSATVTTTGKNLFRFDPVTDSDTVAGLSFSHTETAFTLSGTANSTYKVFVQKYHKIPSGQYIWSVTYTGTNPRSIFTITFRKNGEDVAKAQANSTASTPYATLTVPEEYDDIRFTIEGITNGSSYNMTAYVQLELGSTASAYEPYQAQTITIDLDGTRYGGVVDVLTGMMTVDRAAVLFKDLKNTSGTASANWSYDATNSAFSTANTIIPIGSADADTGIITSCYASRPYGYNGSYSGENAVIWAHTSGSLRVRDNRYTDVNEWKSAVADETIVYPLATPFTVQLTPNQLTTLLGQNHVFADTGDVTLTLRTGAGKMAYQDGISLGNVEASMTVTRDYPADTVIVIGNDIVKTTTAVSAGDTLTVGTNCATATIADWIMSAVASN